jgi:hypothetical protein
VPVTDEQQDLVPTGSVETASDCQPALCLTGGECGFRRESSTSRRSFFSPLQAASRALERGAESDW